MKRLPDVPQIRGAGGGGGGGSAHTPTEAPNTLQSAVKGRILDLIAYGPIYGLVDGLKSVYLDSTPVQNSDDSYNFSGITLETREGYPDQEMIPGFPAVENSIEVGTDVLFDNPPVRSVTNNDADAVLITVQLAALVQQKDNGDSVGASVNVMVDYRQGTGAWITSINDTIQGKTTSPYPVTYRVNLPKTGGPYQVRVRRGNKESESQKLQDKITWTFITEVIDRRLSYPNMALVGISVDSKLFGSSLPSRSYDMKLSIISVPSNYDPATRTYTGLWDGSFKQAWTDNPAWAYYDLASHPVIGGGITTVDKWIAYRIGQYCDELVDDGFGSMEPRFAINTLFAEQEDAIQALNSLASAFRGMSYWGTDTVVPVADMPATPVKIVAPANVVNGDLEYSGTSERERHSVAVVMWNDPNDEYKAVPEIYEDRDSIDAYGWRETRVTAVGCTSRGQALRLAKWILYSERMETQTLTYQATLDHADLRPGDLIEVADPDYQGARMGGRISVASKTQPVLDKVPTEAIQSTAAAWYLRVLMPDGSIYTSQVTSFVGNQANLLTALPEVPVAGAMWALYSVALVLPQFRVVSVTENEDGDTYTVLATEYDPRKYDIVEKDLVLPDLPTSMLPSGPVAPPLDLSFEVYKYYAGGSEHQGLVISWTPPKDARVSSYVLDVMSPSDGGFRTVYNGPGMSFDLRDAVGGEWTIRVRAVSSASIPSQWVTRTVQIANLLLPVPPDSVVVVEKTFEITLSPQSAYRDQLWEFYRSNVPLAADMIESNATQLPTGTYLVDVGLRSNRTYYYYIRGTNQYGKSTWFATQGTTLNDFEDIMNAVKTEIMEGDTYIWLQEEITTVATEAATSVVDEKVAELQEQIDNLVDALAYDPNKAYEKYQVVKGPDDGMLWQATGPVPADETGVNGPPNPDYWINVGEVAEAADGLAAQVETNRLDIENLDGAVKASAERLTGLSAAVRQREDDQGEGALQDALDNYKSKANFRDRVTVIADDTSATAERVTDLSVEVGDNSARMTTLEQVVTDELESSATQITQLRSDFEGNKALVQDQLSTVTNAQSATASQLTTLQTDYNGNKTTVQNQITALSNAQGSQASQISTLQSTVNGHTASIQTNASAIADVDGKLTASYGIKVQTHSNGLRYTAGMGIDITTSGGITQSQILFQADRFALINVSNGVTTLPFLIDSGVVYINTAMIQAASIDFLKISDTLQSTNYVANSTGWKLWKNGTFELNGPVAGGGRMRITNQVIMVYDAAGTLRVRLGIW